MTNIANSAAGEAEAGREDVLYAHGFSSSAVGGEAMVPLPKEGVSVDKLRYTSRA